MVESKEPERIFLVDIKTNTPIPLLRTHFYANISMGFADLILTQQYENNNDYPLEILFMMPYSDSFALNKITVNFTLKDGTVNYLETKVIEREEAKVMYTSAISSGKTAVMSYTESPTESKSMLRVMLGNFPPRSKACLRAICSQKLECEDLSYCFRLPMAFVPPYMGNM